MFPRDVISTGPLVLRAPTADDAEAIAVACDDPVTARFLPLLPMPYTVADARGFLEFAEDRWAQGGAEFAITQDGRHVGGIGLTPPDRWGTTALGYWVAPQARGRGVASMAARAVSDWALDNGARRVELEAEVENLASLRAAYKAGFRREGVRRDAKALRDGRRTDLVGFARLPGEQGEQDAPYLPFFPGGQLTDGVVRLSPLTVEYAESFAAMLADPSVRVWSFTPPPTLEESVRRCRYTGFYWLSGQRIELAVRDAVSGEYAGHLQLVEVAPALGQAMVGYSLVPGFRGRGFMTRALGLLVDWAFANTALRGIVAGTDADNGDSQRVLERAGFSREGVRREFLPRPEGSWADEVKWIRLRPKEG